VRVGGRDGDGRWQVQLLLNGLCTGVVIGLAEEQHTATGHAKQQWTNQA